MVCNIGPIFGFAVCVNGGAATMVFLIKRLYQHHKALKVRRDERVGLGMNVVGHGGGARLAHYWFPVEYTFCRRGRRSDNNLVSDSVTVNYVCVQRVQIAFGCTFVVRSHKT